MKSTYVTHSQEGTIALGMQLANRLKPGSTVLLFGDLGSGKTHFTKGIAKGLGATEIIKSPTFTYVNEYALAEGTILYHYDLYRLGAGDEFRSIGLEDTLKDPHSINIVEWADRLDEMFPPDYIRVVFRNFTTHHEIELGFQDSRIVPDTLLDKYWNDWSTPMHVRAHCKRVADVAVQLGQAMVNRGVILNLDVLKTSGLLHDLARICDFKTLDRNKFHEEITEEKWEKWQDLRKHYAGLHHADVAHKFFMEEGYPRTAEIIRLHNSLSILQEPEKFADLEVAIVFYADKRVMHDQITDLKERFRDGRERHGRDDVTEIRQQYLEVEKKTMELEKKLFSLTDIQPDQIV